ncbi:MAG: hypothetical protein Q8L55_03945 [Phycisphaerales bacterium]|nr:hypothetical protein [Phycisphaerales bacterium]
MTPPPPPRKARWRVTVRLFIAVWTLAFVAFAAVAAIPIFKARAGAQLWHFDTDASGALFPGVPSSPIRAEMTSRYGEAILLGQPVATYIDSRVVWAPSRPSDEALRAVYAGLLRSQWERTAAEWRENDLEGRFTHPPGKTYRRLQLQRGAWVVPVAATVTAALLTLAWSRFSTMRQKRRTQRGHCPGCGYDRSTLDASRQCPECGQVRM